MSDSISVIGLFQDATHIVEAMDDLSALGIPEKNMVILSGVPYPEGSLGHHREWLALPYIVLAGAFGGFLFGLFLSVITPHLYRLDVGGHPVVSFAPAAVITFVFTMMATIVSIFLGVLWEMNFPRFRPAPYHRQVTNGSLGLLLEVPSGLAGNVSQILESHEAHHIGEPERLGQ